MPAPPPPPPQQAPELPALGPHDTNDLFQCLQQSLSNDVAKQKAAESALRQHESRKGFCSCLAVRHALRSCAELVSAPSPSRHECYVHDRMWNCRQSMHCQMLQEIVGTKAADHSARWLAAVQLKNSITKYWRPRLNLTWVLHVRVSTRTACAAELPCQPCHVWLRLQHITTGLHAQCQSHMMQVDVGRGEGPPAAQAAGPRCRGGQSGTCVGIL